MIDPIPANKIPPSPYLGLKDALKSFTLAHGFVIEPVAYGTDVDLVVAISFDANGRAWTCEMRSYMPDINGKGEMTPNGRIRVLEDTNGDGKMDKATTFLDGLVLPRAVSVTSDGCLYTSGDGLYFIKRKGLKPIGKPITVDKNYAKGGNPEHKANGLMYGHDNWYYNAKSTKRYRRIQGKWVSQPTDFRGQWGISKDNAGRLFHNNNSILIKGEQFRPQFFRGNSSYTPPAKMAFKLGSNKVNPIHITPGVNRAYLKKTLDSQGKLVNATAACSPYIYRGDNFPKEMQELGFICEPSGDLIKAVKITRDKWGKPTGSHPYKKKEFLASTDEWFLPCNLYTGPDGTLWMVDMYFGLLQHRVFLTSYLRKQYLSRGLDKPKASTGRIYRIRYANKKATKPPRMEGLSATRLVKFLSHANGLHRDTAQRLIVESGDLSAVEALAKTAENKRNPLAQIHALWTLEGLNAIPTNAFCAALKTSNTDVVSTTLDIISSRRSTDQTIIKCVIQLKPKSQTMHSLVRALAAIGHPEKALDLIQSNSKVTFLREAFISGLGPAAKEFSQSQTNLGDKQLNKLLIAASKKQQTNTSAPGSHLPKKTRASFNRGQQIYTTKAACFACHGGDGNGIDNMGPPLNQSEWVTGDVDRLTKILLHGMTGPVKVGNTTYTPPLAMPGLGANSSITDKDLADVMTYIRNNWKNKKHPVSEDVVKKIRADTKNQATPYSAKDLNS